MKNLIKASFFLIACFVMSCNGGSIESRNDSHIDTMEWALRNGDIETVAEEMVYFDEYDDNGGRFTNEQNNKFRELKRMYPESMRQAKRLKDKLQGKY